MLPINKDSKDPFYRYKMHALNLVREGKQGNPKTIITNFVSVCDSLKRKPELVKQYFIYQLSIQIKLTEKLILNGEFTFDTLQSILYNFIDFLVICKHCDNPETAIKITDNYKINGNEDGESEMNFDGDEIIYLECYACGKTTLINSSQKIISYIFKNTESIDYECYKNNISENDNNAMNNKNITTNMSAKNLLMMDKQNIMLHYEKSNKKLLIQNILTEILQSHKFDGLSIFEDIFQKEYEKKENVFFPILEELIVKKNLYCDFEEITSELLKFLTNKDFAYFKTKSKVISKKESVRIRNMLSNYVQYKEN